MDDNKLLNNLYENCRICPHNCGVNRRAGEPGKCGVSDKLVIASYCPHFGEERELVGRGGSGTIFLAGCNLNCIFCQNSDISWNALGDVVDTQNLVDIMLGLQLKGCENINFVTPTHFTPTLIEAIRVARQKELTVPIVWNCGGYESVETLQMLEGLIQLYMPDAKLGPSAPQAKLSGATDYFVRMTESLIEMHRQVGDLEVNNRGVATNGLLVRHLVLPNQLADSKPIMDFIRTHISKNTYVNIMGQYRPAFLANKHTGLERPVTASEVREVKEYSRKIGLSRGF